MCDETKDISKTEQISVVIRYYLDGTIYERFIGFRAAKNLDCFQPPRKRHFQILSYVIWPSWRARHLPNANRQVNQRKTPILFFRIPGRYHYRHRHFRYTPRDFGKGAGTVARSRISCVSKQCKKTAVEPRALEKESAESQNV
jgi:hypothetical protein